MQKYVLSVRNRSSNICNNLRILAWSRFKILKAEHNILEVPEKSKDEVWNFLSLKLKFVELEKESKNWLKYRILRHLKQSEVNKAKIIPSLEWRRRIFIKFQFRTASATLVTLEWFINFIIIRFKLSDEFWYQQFSFSVFFYV